MKTDFNVKTKIVTAIRKEFRNSLLPKVAFSLACVDESVLLKKRLYKCAMCKENFLKQLIEIDHVHASFDTDLDTFVKNIFCDIVKIQKKQEGNFTEWLAVKEDGSKESLASITSRSLACLCTDCHKIKTKQDRLLANMLKKVL